MGRSAESAAFWRTRRCAGVDFWVSLAALLCNVAVMAATMAVVGAVVAVPATVACRKAGTARVWQGIVQKHLFVQVWEIYEILSICLML